MNIKENDTPIMHTKESAEVTNKTSSVQTKPSYDYSNAGRYANNHSLSSPVSSQNTSINTKATGVSVAGAVSNKIGTSSASTIKTVDNNSVRSISNTPKRNAKRLADAGTKKL